MLLYQDIAFTCLILILPAHAFTKNFLYGRRRSCLFQANPTPIRNGILFEIDKVLSQNQSPESLLKRLESMNACKEPNRSLSHNGLWHVWYTNCPPPSNGKLGPFEGSAQQFIPTEGQGYQNLLNVNDWLTATLDGVWEEWDGQLLVEGPFDATRTSRDWGAEHWKVTFRTLQIALFGFPLFTKTFPAGTSRIWRTTFLDDDVRVVRAGKTGCIDDEVVFYTKRTQPPGGKVSSPSIKIHQSTL